MSKPAAQRIDLAPVDMDDSSGWDNDKEDLIGFEQNDGWGKFADKTKKAEIDKVNTEPFETPSGVPEPEPISAIIPSSPTSNARAVSSFGAPSHPTTAPMKLGQTKPKPLGNVILAPIKFCELIECPTLRVKKHKTIVFDQEGAISKEDKRAELERRREERRQRMAELREKKKSGIGAKKI